MASFRRKTPAASSLRSGTKPFLNGQTLVSSGLSELDAALGGGLLVNTLNVVETPAESSDGASTSLDVGAGASEALAIDLLRYFAAEGVADGKQRVAIVAPDARDFIAAQLPLELSLAQRQVKQQLADTEKGDRGRPADYSVAVRQVRTATEADSEAAVLPQLRPVQGDAPRDAGRQ